MASSQLWNSSTEIQFFQQELANGVQPTSLFYVLNSQYYAYLPQDKKGSGQTLQSRNTLIGKFTEQWAKQLFTPIAGKFNLYALNNVVCKQIGLTAKSPADLALCTTNAKEQSPDGIRIIFEIKMSIVCNYQFVPSNNTIQSLGDYTTHQGNPSLLRSDSMLKAIGKAIKIRVSSLSANKIPIVVLGNSPITANYVNEVDYLKTAGVIQGFWSLYPDPTQKPYIKETRMKGFCTIDSIEKLEELVTNLTNQDMNYFSAMLPKVKLGELIHIASQENSDEARANKFLELLQAV